MNLGEGGEPSAGMYGCCCKYLGTPFADKLAILACVRCLLSGGAWVTSCMFQGLWGLTVIPRAAIALILDTLSIATKPTPLPLHPQCCANLTAALLNVAILLLSRKWSLLQSCCEKLTLQWMFAVMKNIGGVMTAFSRDHGLISNKSYKTFMPLLGAHLLFSSSSLLVIMYHLCLHCCELTGVGMLQVEETRAFKSIL